jgi:hypothetical protein
MPMLNVMDGEMRVADSSFMVTICHTILEGFC